MTLDSIQSSLRDEDVSAKNLPGVETTGLKSAAATAAKTISLRFYGNSGQLFDWLWYCFDGTQQ
ncbi:MAG TPA: hypothetical protein PLK30_16725 [Blastocatellia bacterium]|nr:hypothetical protein [Blastocatellia bacterium]